MNLVKHETSNLIHDFASSAQHSRDETIARDFFTRKACSFNVLGEGQLIHSLC